MPGSKDTKKKHRQTPITANTRLIFILIVAATLLLLFSWTSSSMGPSTLCSETPGMPFTEDDVKLAAEFDKTPTPLVTILHYVTSPMAPQLSLSEIRGPYEILQSLAPCNFLVFGIGHDSLMWDSFNPRGTTLFLEEDPKWIRSILRRFPILSAYTVRYPTRLSQAGALLSSYKNDCWGGGGSVELKGKEGCKLALSNLPWKVYDRDWDVIMIDGPRGYEGAAPGRMGVIYSAAVMARGRRKSGVTHVFLHDTNRKVERRYAKEFLCMKYKVDGAGKLWHFVIPPAFNVSDTTRGFC